MKTAGKIILGVGAVLAVGALAAYGLKKLVEKTDLCGCCDCHCDDTEHDCCCGKDSECCCKETAEEAAEEVAEPECKEEKEEVEETPAEA